MIDVRLRARSAQWYRLAREFYGVGDWWGAIQAQRIACLIWHLADPDLAWPELVHC